jgi:peptide methionine sulfoxide reductase MsrA
VQADSIVLGMGCFWGAEKRMGELPGVIEVEIAPLDYLVCVSGDPR